MSILSEQYLRELLAIQPYHYVSAGTEVLPVDGLGVTLTVPTDSVYAVIQNQGDNIRYWEGGSPTGSQGIILPNNGVVIIYNYSLLTFEAILDSGSASADLHIEYFRRNKFVQEVNS